MLKYKIFKLALYNYFVITDEESLDVTKSILSINYSLQLPKYLNFCYTSTYEFLCQKIVS